MNRTPDQILADLERDGLLEVVDEFRVGIAVVADGKHGSITKITESYIAVQHDSGDVEYYGPELVEHATPDDEQPGDADWPVGLLDGDIAGSDADEDARFTSVEAHERGRQALLAELRQWAARISDDERANPDPGEWDIIEPASIDLAVRNLENDDPAGIALDGRVYQCLSSDWSEPAWADLCSAILGWAHDAAEDPWLPPDFSVLLDAVMHASGSIGEPSCEACYIDRLNREGDPEDGAREPEQCLGGES